jgi:uncharacterized membrane protein YphA (DoxX/SURF4 family)
VERLRINAKRIGPILTHRYLTLATRATLGGVFIFSGIAKLPDPNTLIWEINQYHILPHSLATAYGYILSPLELALGIFLVVGLFLRVSASVSGLLVLSFIIAHITAMARGLEINYCGCFGAAVPLTSVDSLLIDFGLLVLVLQILFHRGDFLSLGHWFSHRAELIDDMPQK